MKRRSSQLLVNFRSLLRGIQIGLLTQQKKDRSRMDPTQVDRTGGRVKLLQLST